MESVTLGYRDGHVTKVELENTLRAHQKTLDGMRSEQRDKADVLLKKMRAEMLESTDVNYF
jgi:hypothetical protein